MTPDFYLSDLLVRPSLNRLEHGDRTIPIEPKVMDVLVCLAQAAGLLSRSELVQSVWGHEFVSEHVLSRCISELRRALGDDHRRPRFIETIRGRGYRLLIAPRPLEDTPPTAAEVPPGPREPSSDSARPVTWSRAIAPSHLASACAVIVFATFTLLLSNRRDPTVLRATDPPALEHPLTSYPGTELDPAYSPDGRRLAFAWRRENDLDIHIRDLPSGDPKRLTSDPSDETNPVWIPGRDRISFVRASEPPGIFAIDAGGGAAERLITLTSGTCPDLAWSPDGRWLYFVDRPSSVAPFSVHRWDSRTGVSRPITDPPVHTFGDRDFALSPDGKRLAYARAVLAGHEELWLSVIGGESRRLVRERSSILGITWEPNGRAIYYSSNRLTEQLLWHLDLEDGEPRPVTSFGRDGCDPVIDASGGRMAFEQQRYRTDLWRSERLEDGTWSEPVPLLPSTRIELQPVFSPEGRRLAFVSSRRGDPELWICDSDGREPRSLGRIGEPNPVSIAWSPNGASLVAPVLDAQRRRDLWQFDVETGERRRLTDDPAVEILPHWSQDGEWVRFGSDREGSSWEAWQVSVGDLRQERLATDAVAWFSTKSGPIVCHGETGAPCRVQSGELHPIEGAPRLMLEAELALGPGGMWFLGEAETGRPAPILWFDSSDQSVRPVPNAALLRQDIPGLGFSVSRDERTLVFTQIEIRDSDIVEVDLPKPLE
ncbi:MAG: winged helix-turn-helix domain-containing protein [Planctomycetota bacterium]